MRKSKPLTTTVSVQVVIERNGEGLIDRERYEIEHHRGMFFFERADPM